MQFAVNDKVRLTSARGGWDGYISQTAYGPGGVPFYEIWNPTRNRQDGTHQWVAEPDIDTSLTPASFSVGDQVVTAGRGGTIQSIDGDLHTVDVVVQITKHLQVTRTHVVPLWNLAVENGR